MDKLPLDSAKIVGIHFGMKRRNISNWGNCDEQLLFLAKKRWCLLRNCI